jgi:uncharacterized protein
LRKNTLKDSRFKSKYGPWALVTGATSGIGQEIAIQLAKRQLNVVLVGRSDTKLNATATLLKREGVEVDCIETDFENEAAIQAVVNGSAMRDIGLFIPAAGFGDAGLFVNADLSYLQKMNQVNITSVMALTHHFANRMKARKRGGIILIGSLLAYHGTPYSANYAATKAFILSLGEALAIELKASNVDVLVSNPGPTASGFGERARMNMGKVMSAQTVAAATLNGLGKSSTVLPGYLSKLLRSALMTAPRFLQVQIIGNIMRGFAQKP